MKHLTEIPTCDALRIARQCRASNIIVPGQWLVGDCFAAFGEARAAWQDGGIAELYSLHGKDGTMVVLARRAPVLALLPAGEMVPKQLSMWEGS